MLPLLLALNATQRRVAPPSAVEERFSLSFPSNVSGADQAAPYVALEYARPDQNGLPFSGPGNAGVTYMWRVKTRQQTGYYVTLWWSNTPTFQNANQYVGGHLYPKSANNSGTTHRYEIAAPDGGDYFDTRTGSGNSPDAEHGVWLTQALRVVRESNGSKTYTFFRKIGSGSDNDILERNSGTGGDIAETPPTTPRLTIGDSPWYADYQHERLSGEFGQLIIVADALSDAEIAAQAADMDSLTAAASSAIWYFKPGWRTVDDLTCEAGTGRALSWASATKATLEVLT